MRAFQAIIRFMVRSISILINTNIGRIQLLSHGFKVPSGMIIDGIVYWKIGKGSKLSIGQGFKLNSRRASNLVGISNRASFQLIGNSEISIGNNCGFTSTVLSCRSKIEIGDNVKLGANVRLLDHDYHSMNPILRKDAALDGTDVKTKPISIGDDVFIGTNAIILKGVKIGAQSVIGAGAVVSSMDIPPNSIVVGNPAKVINQS